MSQRNSTLYVAAVAVASALIISACSKPSASPAPATKPSNSSPRTAPAQDPTLTRDDYSAAAQIRAAVGGRRSRGFEDFILRLESRIPGLGGVFVDSAGRLTVLLTDMRMDSIARRELAAEAGIFRASRRVQEDAQSGRLQFRQADFSFSQIVEWQTAVLIAFGRLPGVQSVDANEATNNVLVRLVEGTDRGPFERALIPLNLPRGAVRFETGPYLRPTKLRN